MLARNEGNVKVGLKARVGILAALAVVSTLVTGAPVEAQAPDSSVPVVAVEEIRTLELDDSGVDDPVAVAASTDGLSLYVIDGTDRGTAVVVDFAERKTGEQTLPSALRGNQTLSLDGADDLVAADRSGPPRKAARGGLEADGLNTGDDLIEAEAAGARYVGDVENNQVLVLDDAGELTQVLDLSSAGVTHLQDLAVAPSGDQTDDPDTLSLYVVDDGVEPAVVKEISTAALVANAAAATVDTATVVQTIDTGTGINPNSPDSSGISWLTASNQLVLSDSEVNEYSYYESNVWHLTTAGTVNSTGETLAWSSEPTGLTVDNSGARSFTTDDNAGSVTEVALGADGLPGTADDTVTRSFSTNGYGNTDPEDVAYDTTRGWLHIVDGANREVYTIDPGANGVFDGGGDDVITQFDTEVHGVLDPEGIAYDAVNDTLTVVDYRDTTAVEFTISGTVIREIDMSASSLDHPAGVTWAPGSDGLSTSLWVVDRGTDASSPRDGQLVEMAVPSIGGPPEPDIFAAPSSVVFGSVVIGNSGVSSVTVTNVGTDVLSVTSTPLSGPDAALFSIDSGGGAFDLGPGLSQVIDLSFSPTVVGSYSATLTINSNDPDEPSVAIPLSGDGVEEPPPADEVTVEAIYQGGSSGSTVVTSETVSITPGRLYLAVVSTKRFEDVTGISGLGASWSPVDAQCSGRNQTGITIYSTTTASTSGVVTATLADAPANAAIAVVEYAGADPANPVGSPVSANTNGLDGACSGGADSDTYSVPVTTTTADSMVTSFVAVRNRTNSPGPGFIENLEFTQGSGGNTVGVAIQSQAVPTPTTVNASGTINRRVDWSVVAVEIRGGPAGPPTPDVGVAPGSLSFGSVVLGSSGSGSVTVSNSGTGTLSVSSTPVGGPDASLFSVDSGGGAFSVAPGGSQVIDLSFSPSAVGSFSATLTVNSDDPDEPSVVVPLSGDGEEAPPIEPDVGVAPGSLSFGSVVLGSSGSGSVTVSNSGTGTLSVSSTPVGGPDASLFSVDSGGGAFSVAPGGSQVIDLSFSPSAVGSFSATLTVNSDDPDEPSVVVPLSGDGVEDPPPAGEVTVEAVYQGGSTDQPDVTSAPVTVTPGRLYLAVVSTKSHRTVQSVTGLGATWTLVDTQCAGRNQTGVTVFSTTSATSSGPVTATLSSTPANAAIAVVEYAGADSAAPLGAPVSANTTGIDGGCSGGSDAASYSVPISTTGPNSLVTGFVAIRNRRHTPGAGFTEILEFAQGSGGNTVGMAIQTQLVPTPSAIDNNGTTSSTVDWAVIAVEIRPG